MEKKIRFTIILILVLIVIGAFSVQRGNSRKTIILNESLDQTVLTVDGSEMTFRDMAFYIAYEEKNVQKDAIVYNPENPNKYWNVYTDEQFVRLTARKAVVSMAVHDEIMYQLARAEHVTLDATEEAYYENEASDFCSDLTDGQWEALGVSEDTLRDSMYKIAVANKYQTVLAQMEGAAYEDYDFSGASYQKLLEEHEYILNESLWERLPMGNITYNNY